MANRDFREFLAGAFFVSSGTLFYLSLADVSVSLLGTGFVETSQISGGRSLSTSSCSHSVAILASSGTPKDLKRTSMFRGTSSECSQCDTTGRRKVVQETVASFLEGAAPRAAHVPSCRESPSGAAVSLVTSRGDRLSAGQSRLPLQPRHSAFLGISLPWSRASNQGEEILDLHVAARGCTEKAGEVGGCPFLLVTPDASKVLPSLHPSHARAVCASSRAERALVRIPCRRSHRAGRNNRSSEHSRPHRPGLGPGPARNVSRPTGSTCRAEQLRPAAVAQDGMGTVGLPQRGHRTAFAYRVRHRAPAEQRKTVTAQTAP